MAAKTFYFRSTASSVVSANASVDLLSETQGSAETTGTSSKHAKNVNTWQFIPDTTSNTTTIVIGSTPNSQGWIWDASTPGTFATGTWTFNLDISDTSATGTAVLHVNAWVVTATTTTVTSVSNFVADQTSASFTPPTSSTQKAIAVASVPSVTLAANQYIYVETYVQMTVASTSATGTMTFVLDSNLASVGNIVTPNFTPTVAVPTQNFLAFFYQKQGAG